MSRLIATLEDELGLRLFVRTGRRLVPTEEGLRFYDETKRVLAGIDEISSIAKDIRTVKEPRLRVMCQPYLAYALLPESFAAFEKIYPALRFSLEIRSRGDVGPWIAGQQFDLGIADRFSGCTPCAVCLRLYGGGTTETASFSTQKTS